MKKHSAHKKKMRAWIISNHTRINNSHQGLKAQGFQFEPGKIRFWLCNDSSVSIRLVYCKNQKAWREEQAILLKMRIDEEKITVRECDRSFKFTAQIRTTG